MKIKDLIEKLAAFDSELEIGGEGHFGEMLEIWDVSLSSSNRTLPFVVITIESAGQEPD